MLGVGEKIEIQKELAVIKFQYIRVVLVDLHIVLFYILCRSAFALKEGTILITM